MSIEEAQSNLQKALVESYMNNMKFLKEYDFELYKRVDNLSLAIDKEIYKERYFLEFIEQTGEFDIYDSATNSYLYNKKAKKFNHNLINNIRFDLSSYFSAMVKSMYPLDTDYEEFNLDYESYEELEPLLNNQIKEYTDVLKDDMGDRTLKSVEKFIFLGTLLGRHIHGIEKKINAKNYFVYENNLEIFRISLFVTSYVVLAQNSNVRFSIMDDEQELIKKFNIFLEDNPYQNYCLKFVSTEFNVTKAVHLMISSMYMQSPTIFDYTKLLHNLVKLSVERINKNKILTIQRKPENFDFCEDKPVLFVAAGPSLQKHITWIEKNKEKFIIVALGASYKKLLNHGIKSDIISTLDASYEKLSQKQFSPEDIKQIKDTVILASINSAPQICNQFNQNELFFYEMYFTFKENSLLYSGYSVGEITVSILLHLGIKDIYLLGSDLALNQETGETHIGEHKDNSAKDLTTFDEIKALKENTTSFEDEVILVPGAFKKEVFTTRLLASSITGYTDAIKTFANENQNIINLSTFGAQIPGTKPIDVNSLVMENFETLDKTKLNELLVSKFDSVSERSLTENELKMINEELDYYSNLSLLLDQVELTQYNNIIELRNSFEEIESYLRGLKRPTYLYYILVKYFKFINTYIYFHFNNKKVKNEAKKIDKIKFIWCKQVSGILEDYLGYLKKI